MGDFQVPVSTCALGMDDTLGNTLSVEMGEKVDMVEVLEQQRAIDTCSLCAVGLVDGGTVGSGVEGVVGRREDLLGRHDGGGWETSGRGATAHYINRPSWSIPWLVSCGGRTEV